MLTLPENTKPEAMFNPRIFQDWSERMFPVSQNIPVIKDLFITPY